jgi:release factor glutamine methyltransferase
MDPFDDRLAHLSERLEVLPDKPEETPESTLRALWLLAAGTAVSAEGATALPLPRLSRGQQATLDRLIRRRLRGEPLAHLTGRQRFMGLEMLAGPQALIPRRETELLARTAIDLIAPEADTIVVDACTGSGNVAAATAHARPRARVHASDLSPDATQLAARNLEFLGLTARVELRTGDLLTPFEAARFHGRVDLLTCNPPYISLPRRRAMAREVADHEPELAFDGGALGISVLQRLIADAPRLLRPGGWLAFEVGAGQGPAVARKLSASEPYDEVVPVADAQGEVRVLTARRRSDA